jgi:2-polyprenyl-3-methyl-5-hydroxy-6-metoxy-1,4-benzoquinol methylase
MTARSGIGAALVRAWARETLAHGAAIVDVGCGSGTPIAQALVEDGFEVSGIDASPTLIAAFRERFPDAPAACEAAQDSAFFGRSFDAAVAVGLLFLLAEDDQGEVLRRVAACLRPGGRFLFSAPREPCEWPDMLTGRRSVSLGAGAYERLLRASGLQLVGCRVDEGQNNYYEALKPAS